jgi:Ca2+-binding RTX toxin-like protein
VFGDAGNDTLLGGDGDDTLYGGKGDDSLDGGEGNDLLFSRSGNDTLSGGPGDDWLFNSNPDGQTLLSGDAGQDWLINENGDATIVGGEGRDVIDIFFETGNVVLENFEPGIDELLFSSVLLQSEPPRTGYTADGDAVLWLDNDASITFAGLDTLPDQIL